MIKTFTTLIFLGLGVLLSPIWAAEPTPPPKSAPPAKAAVEPSPLPKIPNPPKGIGAPEPRPALGKKDPLVISVDRLLADSTIIAHVQGESWAAPTVLNVKVIKVYKGKGDPAAKKAGWEEGKSYPVDVGHNDWKKSWALLTPKYDPIGKEMVVFIAMTGKLEATGELKQDLITLSCARPAEKCKFAPVETIKLSELQKAK